MLIKLFLILIFTLNPAYSKEIYSNKEELLKNIKETLIKSNNKTKYEKKIELIELNLLFNFNENGLFQISNQVIEDYFNTDINKIYSSYYNAIQLLSFSESIIFIEQFPLDKHINNLIKGNFISVDFSNKDNKTALKNKNGTFTIKFEVHLSNYINNKLKFKTKSNVIIIYSNAKKLQIEKIYLGE